MVEDVVDTETSCAAPRRGGWHFAGRCGVFAVRLCGMGVVLVAALLVGLAVLLSRGPLEIEAASRLAEGALAELGGPGADAHVGAARLDWSWTGGVSVALSEISLARGSATRLDLPRLVVHLRMLPLLIGEMRPRVVEIVDPRLVLDTSELHERREPVETPVPVDRPDAPLAPASAPAAPATPVSTRLAEAADVAVERVRDLARAQGVEKITLRGGSVAVHHVSATGTARDVRFEDLEAEATIDRSGHELDARLSARGARGSWSMRLARERRADGGHGLVFSAESVTLPDLIGPITPPFRFDMPFAPRLRLGFDRDGRFDGAAFDLDVGQGTVRFGGMREDELRFDAVTASAVWNPRDRVFVIEHATAALGETRWNAHGRVTPPAGGVGAWTWALDLDPGRLKPLDLAKDPAVPVLGGTATGSWDPATAFFDVTLGEVRFGEATLRSAGRLDLSGETPKFTYDLQFTPLTTAELIHGWPTWVAAEARDWFVENVSAGRVSDLRIQLNMPSFDHPETWAGDAMRISARFDGVRFRPLGNLPAVTAAEGRLSVADRRFEAVIDKARADTHGHEPAIDGFRFAVADIFVKPPRGSVRLHVAGETNSLAEIVDAEPLSALSQSGMAATGFSGTGSVTAQVDVLFTDPLLDKSIDYRIEAALDGFAAQQPIQGRKFQDGKFKIVADKRGLDIAGRAVVDGVPADVHVYDPAGSSKANEKRDFKMEVDDAARQRLGIDLGGVVEGAIGLAVSQPDPNQLRSRIEADLTPARLDFAPLGWSKGPGVPAKATFDLWDDDKGIHVDNVALDSEGLSLRGNLLLDRDRNLVSADFPRFALRKGDAGKVKVTRGADKALTIAFDGASFDARGLLQYSRRPPQVQDPAKTPDLILKLKLGRVVGFNDVVVTDLDVDGHWKAGAFQWLELRGRVGPKQPLSIAIRPEGDHRRFSAVSENAGKALSFLDLFDRIEGGKLTITASLHGPGISEGRLNLVAFHLLEEPKSGRGVAGEQAADGTRRFAIRRAEIDRSTDFDRAQVRFAMHDGIIDVVEGVAKGTSVGATATGQLDVAGQRLSLSGTYIPAFSLNNLAGRIPIFGAITGAGSNEGLVGVTFRVGGPIEDPILQINPLSAVAPGIFRRIFEFQREDMPQSAGDPNAPTNIMPDTGPTKITP